MRPGNVCGAGGARQGPICRRAGPPVDWRRGRSGRGIVTQARGMGDGPRGRATVYCRWPPPSDQRTAVTADAPGRRSRARGAGLPVAKATLE